MEQENKQGRRALRSILIVVVLSIAAVGMVYLFVKKPWTKLDDLSKLDYIDLTTMNSTMVYAYVNDIVNIRPNAYLGKTIKARGQYSDSYSSALARYRHYVVVSDATACCSRGIEFLYEGQYPDDAVGIVVTGTYEMRSEQGKNYYYIIVTELAVS